MNVNFRLIEDPMNVFHQVEHHSEDLNGQNLSQKAFFEGVSWGVSLNPEVLGLVTVTRVQLHLDILICQKPKLASNHH